MYNFILQVFIFKKKIYKTNFEALVKIFIKRKYTI